MNYGFRVSTKGWPYHSERMENLKEVVAPYLTKQDYLIRTLVEDGKTFSHGRLPLEPPKSGRPRKYAGAEGSDR